MQDSKNSQDSQDSEDSELKTKKEKNKMTEKIKKPKNILVLAIIIAVIFGTASGLISGFLASELTSKSLRELIGQNQVTKNQGVAENDREIEGVETGTVDLSNLVKEDKLVVSVVAEASPAVVSIIVTKDIPKLNNSDIDPFFSDPFFRQFGFPAPERDPSSGSGETQRQEIGGGTGFIVDKDGYLITNRHVVNDEQADYTVVTNDGTEYEAEVLARDSFMDLAVLKIAGENLPIIELGNSDNLKIGQTVIAIGNSLGEFSNTVSKGIISGLKRNVNAGDGLGRTELLSEVIQTDAAINPGNSGGPIVDLRGQVVGINVAMASGAENIGFSIPVNEARNVYESVKETGKIVRPFLGVRYVIVDEKLSEENGLKVDYGALIIGGENRTELAIIPGSPADKAGLEENDIILEVDDKRITEKNDLARIIKNKTVGDVVNLKVWHDGEVKDVEVVLEEAV